VCVLCVSSHDSSSGLPIQVTWNLVRTLGSCCSLLVMCASVFVLCCNVDGGCGCFVLVHTGLWERRILRG